MIALVGHSQCDAILVLCHLSRPLSPYPLIISISGADRRTSNSRQSAHSESREKNNQVSPAWSNTIEQFLGDEEQVIEQFLQIPLTPKEDEDEEHTQVLVLLVLHMLCSLCLAFRVLADHVTSFNGARLCHTQDSHPFLCTALALVCLTMSSAPLLYLPTSSVPHYLFFT